MGLRSSFYDSTAALPHLHLYLQITFAYNKYFIGYNHHIMAIGTDNVNCVASFARELIMISKSAATSAQGFLFEANHNGKVEYTKVQIDKVQW